MRRLILIALLLVSTPVFAQDALSILKGQIGDLFINNANLSNQINRLNDEHKKLTDENKILAQALDKAKADLTDAQSKKCDTPPIPQPKPAPPTNP